MPISSNVLLVDDDATALVALKGIIQQYLPRVQVEIATTGRAALERIGGANFDAVVTDIKMPLMDGLELLGHLRRLRPGLPVVLVSSYEDYAWAVQALRQGAYDLLRKPVEIDYFVRALRSALLLGQVRRRLLVHRTDQAGAPLLQNTTVLVVDDSDTTRALLARLLQKYGARVLAAASAAEAIALVEQCRPDVLLSDVRMPVEDGYGLVRRLRCLPADAGGAIPAVAITAFSDEEQHTRALAAGYQLQLPKQTEPEVLALVLAVLVKPGP
jgi:CheY-like chemotaxis protein